MRIELPVNLDATLGCGQAHRWIKKDGRWEGVLGDEIVTLEQRRDGFECEGTSDKEMILSYFRAEDDLEEIYADISGADVHMARLAEACPGLRILRQDPWECTATYLLAVNANVKRIGSMVESVCREFGRDLGGRYSFPAPEEIGSGCGDICRCRLGYREGRFLRLAESVRSGEHDPLSLRKLDYQSCRNELMRIEGIGPKVADCISLFAYGHMEAFPVDARISRVMADIYGVSGNYSEVAEEGRRRFGKYPGYAQELLYHSVIIFTSQAQDGGLHPV